MGGWVVPSLPSDATSSRRFIALDTWSPPASRPTQLQTTSIVEFVQMLPEGRPPKRADRSGAGYIPARALRFCDALCTSTGYGYWLFPPIDMSVLWDGEQVFWSIGDTDEWMALSGSHSGAAQFPDFAAYFDENCPANLRGYSPPFITALPELGGVQIWTGMLARTAPGWSLNVRQPVNIPVPVGLSCWEGIIESDHWFGPLFSNFRITKTDFPVRLRAQQPFLQVQPIPQLAYRDSLLNEVVVTPFDGMSEQDWGDFGGAVLPNDLKEASQGTYAVRLRKRRSCPHELAKQDSAVREG